MPGSVLGTALTSLPVGHQFWYVLAVLDQESNLSQDTAWYSPVQPGTVMHRQQRGCWLGRGQQGLAGDSVCVSVWGGVY